MGNRSSSNVDNQRSGIRYGSIAEDETSLNDSTSLSSNVEPLEYRSTRQRKLALVTILACQFFNVTVFTSVTFLLPHCLQVHVFYFNKNATSDYEEYHHYMHKLQMIPVLALILLCSCGWIAGLLIDTCVRKTYFILAAQVLVSVGSCVIMSTILGLAKQVVPSGVTPEKLYGSLNLYTGLVCAVSVISSIIRTVLPALGGDQIPDRDGVRIFYAVFYWSQKAGEVISTGTCLIFLYGVPWGNVYHNLLLGGVIAVSVLAFLSIAVTVFSKSIRQANPRVSGINDTWLIWKEEFQRRKYIEKEKEDGFLDLAKSSSGGSFADQAVDDRMNMLKFAVVLLLLIPVACATMLPLLPVISMNTTAIHVDRSAGKHEQSRTAVAIYMVRYTTALIAIPVIHIICTRLARCGRPLNILHRFLGGHIFMIGSIVALIATQKYSTKEFTVESRIAQMVLLGVCNAIINTTGYELTLLSAPRAMQGTAMGMFYLMDGIANMINMGIIVYMDFKKISLSLQAHNIINGIGAGGMALSMLLIYVAEKKFNLGLSKV